MPHICNMLLKTLTLSQYFFSACAQWSKIGNFLAHQLFFKFTDTATVLNKNNEGYLCFADTCKVSGTKVDFNKPLFNI